MMTYILLLILLGIIIFHSFVRFGRRGKIAKKIPGPMSFPIIGNMLSFDIASPGILNINNHLYISSNI